MASFFGSARDGTMRLAERSLLRRPLEGAARNLFVGCIMLLWSGLGFIILGLFVPYNIFVAVTGHLVGVSILLEGAARLVFEQHRALAVRVRLSAAVAGVLSSASFLAMIFHWIGVLPLGA